MMSSLLSFIVTCIIVELTPGPNMTYLAALSSVDGFRAGLSTVVGIAAGLLAVGLAAAFGIAALIAQDPALYQALRLTGAAYMLWLAWDTWRNVPAPSATQDFDVRYAGRGFVTNILNPKALIFYVTVLPAFIDTQEIILPQYIALTLIYVCIATCVHLAIVVLAGRLYSRNALIVKHMHRLFALLLITIACWLALPEAL